MTRSENGAFIRLGLIGYPLGHSVSPMLHEAALKSAGLSGEYRLYPIQPGPEDSQPLTSLIDDMRAGALAGLNVTIPHKRRILDFVDDLDMIARSVGAVNTLVMREGHLVGENTDVPGFLHDLKGLRWSPEGTAVLLGAGGSARAVAYALVSSGWDVVVAARRKEQADQLAEEIGSVCHAFMKIHGIEFTPQSLKEAAGKNALVVNATPSGMHPKVKECPWPENIPLPAGGAVYDLVYNPAETKLSRLARVSGVPVLTGAGMLVAQAALSFHAWTGYEPPFTIMQKAFRLP